MSLKLADFDAEHSTSISQLYTTKSDRGFESILIYVSADKIGWGYPPEESDGGNWNRNLTECVVRSEP